MLKKFICFLCVFNILGANVCFANTYTKEEANMVEQHLQRVVNGECYLFDDLVEIRNAKPKTAREPLTEEMIGDDLRKYMEKRGLTIEDFNNDIQKDARLSTQEDIGDIKNSDCRIKSFDINTLKKVYFADIENYAKENGTFIKGLNYVSYFEALVIAAIAKNGSDAVVSFSKGIEDDNFSVDSYAEYEGESDIYKELTDEEVANIVKDYVKNTTGKDEEIKDMKNISFALNGGGMYLCCVLLENDKEYVVPYKEGAYYYGFEQGKVYTVQEAVIIAEKVRKGGEELAANGMNLDITKASLSGIGLILGIALFKHSFKKEDK